MEVLEAIRTRRSIRHYTSDPVDEKALQQILEAGRWAPSWANTQCSRFIVVRERQTMVSLADTLIKINKRPDGTMDNPAARAFTQAPVLLVVCAEMGRSGSGHDSAAPVTDKGDWFMFDTALAVENMVLAAHALGLGTVILGAFDAAKAARILGVPEGYSVVAMLPLGIPAREGKAPPRKELAEIAFKEKFGR
jgi:nitroreductase